METKWYKGDYAENRYSKRRVRVTRIITMGRVDGGLDEFIEYDHNNTDLWPLIEFQQCWDKVERVPK